MSHINKQFINMYDLLICLTSAGDLVRPEFEEHHQRVAYIAFQIADHMGLSSVEKKDLVLAGLLHDIGALSLNERMELLENEPPMSQGHAYCGARLIENFPPLQNAARIIRYHHVPWNYGEGAFVKGKPVHRDCHILHLADRIAVMVKKDKDMLSQIKGICASILERKDAVFMPELVDVFLSMSIKEYIWLDIAYSPLIYLLPQIVMFETIDLDMDEVIALTEIFSRIIDYRSPFTSYHCAGVAKTAQMLAQLAGFSATECKMVTIAGNLHDLGKLAVKRELLEKQGKLDSQEYNEVKSHSFYTYRLLQSIKGFETISMWASFHHEKLNGKGYPFHLKEENIPLGARIIAVADVFTAIMEERPYRKGVSIREAVSILRQMVEDGSLCPYVVSLLITHFNMINEAREEAQSNASGEYRFVMQGAQAAQGL